MPSNVKNWIFVVMCVLSAGAVHAGNTSFSADEVEGFIQAMETLEARRDEFKNIPDNEPGDMTKMIGNDGSVRVFRSFLPELQQYPAEEKKLLGIVRDAGFKSINHWATAGDKIMMTYMSVQMDDQSNAESQAMKEMLQMTPEMMAMIPEGMREMVTSSLKMARAAENVSAADKTVLAPYLARLEAVMH